MSNDNALGISDESFGFIEETLGKIDFDSLITTTDNPRLEKANYVVIQLTKYMNKVVRITTALTILRTLVRILSYVVAVMGTMMLLGGDLITAIFDFFTTYAVLSIAKSEQAETTQAAEELAASVMSVVKELEDLERELSGKIES